MEQYKQINAELMDQVQKQRITIGEMLKTNVLLKKQLLEEREIRLADAQYTENKLKCAIKTLLNTLDLNLDDNIGFMGSRNSVSSENGRQNIYSRGQVCSELRYSTALLQRKVTVSPIRHSRSRSQRQSSVISCNNSLDEDIENPRETSSLIEKVATVRRTPEPRHLVELQENMNSPDTPETAIVASDSPGTQPISTTPAIVDAYMYSIIEESDGEDNTSSSTIELNETPTLRGTNSNMDISALPLRDLTNKSIRRHPSPNIPKTQGISHTTQNDSENMQESCIEQVRCVLQQSSIGHLAMTGKVTKTRGKSSRVAEDDTQPSIGDVRLDAEKSSAMQLTVPCTSMKPEPVLTPRRSLLNFSSFNGIVGRPEDSSTPRRDQETVSPDRKVVCTKGQPKRTKSTFSRIEQSSSESSILSRPSRSCRPKSLKEPNCMSKLRNEGQTK